MNGTNLLNTAKAASAAGLAFPAIPEPYTMLNKNYTAKPVIFG